MKRSKILLVTLAVSFFALGRQASAQVTTYHACSGSAPAANEVFVWADANYTGTCAALYVGFYPQSGTGTGGFGINNDSISSIQIGSSVRARIFENGVYGGNFTDITSNQYYLGTSGWNDRVSSIRVVSSNRSASCDDLQSGEFAVYRDENFGSDCVVLTYAYSSYKEYDNPSAMGIANDSISSVRGGPTMSNGCSYGGLYVVKLYDNDNLNTSIFGCVQGNDCGSIGNANDRTTSIWALISCNIP